MCGFLLGTLDLSAGLLESYDRSFRMFSAYDSIFYNILRLWPLVMSRSEDGISVQATLILQLTRRCVVIFLRISNSLFSTTQSIVKVLD